jgi:hypothetical protein
MEGGFNETQGPIRFKQDIMSDEASKYTEGERVHYRGDSMPTRLWKISDVGDRLLTIEAETTMGLDAMDTTKIVTAADIYRQGEYSNSLPFQEPLQPMAGLYNSFDEANYATMPMRQPITQGMPAINFAPVIKVLNGGSDFSTDPTNGGDAQLSDTAAGISSMISPVAVPTITSSSGGESSNVLPDGPLIVKKV